MDVADLVQSSLQDQCKEVIQQNHPSWQCNSSRTTMDKNHPAETSAGNAGDGGIGKRIAHPPMQYHFKEEDVTCVDDAEDVVVDAEVGELETRLEELMLPCMCRMQVLLDRQCNRYRVQPQCPRNRRETE